MKCPFSMKGCRWNGVVVELYAHLTACEYANKRSKKKHAKQAQNKPPKKHKKHKQHKQHKQHNESPQQLEEDSSRNSSSSSNKNTSNVKMPAPNKYARAVTADIRIKCSNSEFFNTVYTHIHVPPHGYQCTHVSFFFIAHVYIHTHV